VWQIPNQTSINCYVDSLIQETLNIAGATINIWKLLGVHEQTKLTDLTGTGSPISSGDAPHYPVTNAFDIFNTKWVSRQTGQAVITSAYIGYDFGIIRNSAGTPRYGVDANVRQHVTSFKIKQSTNPQQRATKVRVERSDTGQQWYGVAVVTLPDNDQLNRVDFKHSVPNRYWRLRPIEFNGTTCDAWSITALEMFDFEATAQTNIQDKILMENRDREYSQSAISLKGYYDLLSVATDLSRFGIEIPSSTYQIRVNFNATVNALGRPIVIGDIIDLPSETQYTPDLRPVKRYLEVTDVTWDSTSYTPGWMPTMLLLTTAPAMATQETQDIFGDLASKVDTSELFSGDDGTSTVWQDYSTIDQTIRAEAASDVPERGSLGSDIIREMEPEEIAQLQAQVPSISVPSYNPNGLYVEDAMPANGEPFTEGPTFPTGPKDKDYHRMLYVGTAGDVPARLYRWSSAKGRWIFMEQDKRQQFNFQKSVLDEYLTNSNKVSPRDIK
jgi:hypothetical protein